MASRSNLNVVAIIQARTGSTRFPNKVFAEISGKSVIEHIVKRLSYCNGLTKIVLATTVNNNDDSLVSWAEENDLDCFRGSEENVLARYFECAKEFEADTIVRITADDPLKSPRIIDQIIAKHRIDGLDFCFNNNPPSFPEGMDVEVFTMDALRLAFENGQSDFEKEHVTQYFYRNIEQFKTFNVRHNINLSHLRWTLDTKNDFELINKIYNDLYKEGELFEFEDILTFLDKHPTMLSINSMIERSDMYKN